MATGDGTVRSMLCDRRGEPFGTSEVAEALGCSRRAAYDRLDRLAEAGDVRTKKVGAKSRVWWVPPGSGDGNGDSPGGDGAGGRSSGEGSGRPVTLERFHERVEALVGAPADDLPAEAVAVADDLLDLPMSGVHLVGDDGDRLEPAAVTDAAREVFDGPRVYGRDGGGAAGAGLIWDAFERGEPVVVEDTREHPAFEGVETPVGSGLVCPLGDHGVFLASSPDPDDVDPTSRALAELLATTLGAALDRADRERRLRRFQDRVQDLFRASPEEVPAVATGIADDLLDLPISGVNLLSDDGQRLEPAAATDAVEAAFDDPRVYERHGDSVTGTDLAWDAFERGEPVVVEDTDEHPAFEGEDPVARSGLVYPLGDHGVYVATSREPGAVDATNRALAGVLATTLTAALDRADRERELRESERRYRRLLRTAPVPMGVFTADEGFVYVNDAAVEFLGADDREAVLGRSPAAFSPPEHEAWVEDRVADIVEDDEVIRSVELEVDALDGERRVVLASSAPTTFDGEPAGQFVFRDVTEYRRARETIEEQRRFFQRAIDVVDDVFYVVDDDRLFRWNETLAERTGYDDDELAEMSPADLLPNDQIAALKDGVDSILDLEENTVEMDLVTADGERIPHEFRAVTYRDGTTGESYRVGVGRDVTERRERERRLRRSEQRYRRLLETSPAPVLIYDADGEVVYCNDAAVEFLGVDEREELLSMSVGDLVPDGQERRVARRHRRLVEEDEPTPPVEHELPAFDGETKHAMVASAPVTYEGEDAIQTVAIDVTDRVRQRRALRRQRDRIETLNWLNEVVQGTAYAVADASSRAEVERRVRERLADSEPFDGAWIGDPGRPGRDDGTDPPGRLPDSGVPAAVEAVESGDPRALGGSRAGDDAVGVAVPVTHEGVQYGALVVYADREDPFDEDERGAVRRVADILAHAFAAVDRKAALMGEAATELEFRSEGLMEPLLALTRETDAEVDLDRAVPLEDRTVLYCRLSGVTPEGIADYDVESGRIRSARRIEGVDTGTRFEVVVEGETVVSQVAAAGGRIRTLRFADGEARLHVEAPLGSDVRSLVEAVTDDYDGFELVARERVGTADADPRPTDSVDELLTDRQRAAVEAAFFAGYFESPRRSTGSEVADVLGVSSPTFHEHLRIAERKLLDALLPPGV